MKIITAEDLKTMLYVVASDEMEGRETGSKGQKKAGLYMIEQYKKMMLHFLKEQQIITNIFLRLFKCKTQ